MLTDQQRDEACTRFGPEAVVFESAKHGLFVFTKPKRHTWIRFQKEVSKDASTGFENLCRECFAFPDLDGKPDYEKWTALLEDFPGCAVEIGDKLAIAARGGEAVSAGKR